MMIRVLYHISKQFDRFMTDKQAVLGLPMRLTVSLVIGSVALAAILAFIINPCLFPSKMIIHIDPMVDTVNETDDSSIFNITVYDIAGHPIKSANVIIKGLSAVGASVTDENGKTKINISGITLENGVNEGYLDVIVKAVCHETFSQPDMLKIVRK